VIIQDFQEQTYTRVYEREREYAIGTGEEKYKSKEGQNFFSGPENKNN
jgi:hypothetical protein